MWHEGEMVDRFILSDFEEEEDYEDEDYLSEAEATTTDGGGTNDESTEDDDWNHVLVFEEAVAAAEVRPEPAESLMKWSRYTDPTTERIFWTTEDEYDAFFEDGQKWKCYRVPFYEDPRILWWSKVGDDASWFFKASGTKSL